MAFLLVVILFGFSFASARSVVSIRRVVADDGADEYKIDKRDRRAMDLDCGTGNWELTISPEKGATGYDCTNRYVEPARGYTLHVFTRDKRPANPGHPTMRIVCSTDNGTSKYEIDAADELAMTLSCGCDCWELIIGEVGVEGYYCTN